MINLSDDIVIESLEVSNKEDFSESLFEVTVEGSIDYPPTKWLSLGTLVHPNTILPVSGERMIRYLKLTLRGPKNRSNLYCTLTNVKVYGHSMNFVMRKSLTDLNTDDELLLNQNSEPEEYTATQPLVCPVSPGLEQLASAQSILLDTTTPLLWDAASRESSHTVEEDEEQLDSLLKRMVQKLKRNEADIQVLSETCIAKNKALSTVLDSILAQLSTQHQSCT